MSGTVMLIALAAGGLWYAGHKTVQGVQKVDHKIAHVFHLHKHHTRTHTPPPQPVPVPGMKWETRGR